MDIKPIIDSLYSDIIKLGKASLKEHIREATADAKVIVERAGDDLERWMNLLATNELSKREFVSLVEGQKDLFQMQALKRAGLAQIKLDEFKKNVVSLITSSVFKAAGV